LGLRCDDAIDVDRQTADAPFGAGDSSRDGFVDELRREACVDPAGEHGPDFFAVVDARRVSLEPVLGLEVAQPFALVFGGEIIAPTARRITTSDDRTTGFIC
jgi:hypothetical protein